jgi:hypothetical protein
MAARTFCSAWGFTLLLLAVAGCGAGTSASKGPDHGTTAAESDESEEGEDSDEAEPRSKKPRRPRCDDGTCFECGAGICPSGFYCDQNAEGGAACSWLPECPSKASCGCVKKTLGSGCSCEERAGGTHVDCSP